jgi:SAM-dependent methyltransferase
MNNTVLIISGTGNPARAAANIYFSKLPRKKIKVHLIENISTIKFIFKILYKRIVKLGLINTVSSFLCRFCLLLKPKIKKKYNSDFKIGTLAKIPISYLKQIRPKYIITNACSLLDAKTIKILQSTGAKIINVHNGITPRYRGTGNLWAFYERNFKMAGVTLHYLSKGIDTGKTISSKKIDFFKKNCTFEETDTLAFSIGAGLAVDYICKKHKIFLRQNEKNILSRLYTYPTHGEYKIAKSRFEAAKKEKNIENTWAKSFKEISLDKRKDVYQRLHWGDSKSVILRDKIIKTLVSKFKTGNYLIDLGCGNGRYSDLLSEYKYWGLDFSLKTIKLGKKLKRAFYHKKLFYKKNKNYYVDKNKNHFLVASVNKIPLKNSSFDKTLAIGLFQHLDNTGSAADEILRITRNNGYIFINTLRQFSKLELAILFFACTIKSSLFLTLKAIWNQEYFSNKIINKINLARRFNINELRRLFEPQATVKQIKYQGIFGTRIFSREIYLVLQKKIKKNPK